MWVVLANLSVRSARSAEHCTLTLSPLGVWPLSLQADAKSRCALALISDTGVFLKSLRRVSSLSPVVLFTPVSPVSMGVVFLILDGEKMGGVPWPVWRDWCMVYKKLSERLSRRASSSIWLILEAWLVAGDLGIAWGANSWSISWLGCTSFSQHNVLPKSHQNESS